MKKLFILMIVLLLPFFALEMNADEEKAIITIPIELGPEKNLTRSQGEEQIICHYNGMMASIITTISQDLGIVNITVANCYTGEIWQDTFNSYVQHQSILQISGEPGLYEIIYITGYEEVYMGNFVIE